MVCAVCKTKKPISAITPHQSTNKWTCKGCTWVNPRKFLRCEMCEAKRPIASKSPLERTTPKVSRPTVAKTIESSTERPKRKLPMERKVQNSNLVPKDDSFALRMKIERLEKKLANKNRLIENLKKSLIKLRASQVTKPSTGIFGMPSTQNTNKKKTTKKRRASLICVPRRARSRARRRQRARVRAARPSACEGISKKAIKSLEKVEKRIFAKNSEGRNV